MLKRSKGLADDQRVRVIYFLLRCSVNWKMINFTFSVTVTRQQEFRKCWFLRIIQPNLYRYRFRELKKILFKRHDLTTYPEAIHRIQGLRRRITCRFTVKGRGFSWPISTDRHRPRTVFFLERPFAGHHLPASQCGGLEVMVAQICIAWAMGIHATTTAGTQVSNKQPPFPG